ncbi:MAG: CNNM domain-containing protein [Dermatophilaceae bacterium]
MSQAGALWVSLLLLLANAFFVGAEFAAMASRRSTLEPLAEAGSARARMSLDALEHMGDMLVTAQLGITVCSVGLGALAEKALDELLHPLLGALPVGDIAAAAVSLVLALLIVVYLHVVVGEMIPKNLAIAGPDRAALVLVPPLLLLARALRPLVRLMGSAAKTVVRLMGVEPKDEIASAFTADEVAHIVAESHREGLIEEERQGLVRSALEFSDKVASQVAVATGRLVTVTRGVRPIDIERLVAEHGYSRYPFVDDDGELTGYVHLKDVLYADDERHEQPIPAKRVRALATVSPGDEIEDVLATMQRTGAHLARIVGADGRVTGVVFLEDVIEVLVGEVRDATQRESSHRVGMPHDPVTGSDPERPSA